MSERRSSWRPIALLFAIVAIIAAGSLWSANRAQELAPGDHAFADGRILIELPEGGSDVTTVADRSDGRSFFERLFGPERVLPGFRHVNVSGLGSVTSSTFDASMLRRLFEQPMLGRIATEDVRLASGQRAQLHEFEGPPRDDGPGFGSWRLVVPDVTEAHELIAHFALDDPESRERARAFLLTARLLPR